MSVVKDTINAFKSRMISGTGWSNHIIAHHFGWCELSEHVQDYYEEELWNLWHHTRQTMYMNDNHHDVALNSIVSAAYTDDKIRFKSDVGNEKFTLCLYQGKFIISKGE